jgi:ribonuclease P protein component
MRRSQRLRHRRDFATVYRRGHAVRGELLIVRALRGEGPLARFGFAVSRAVGGAVVRNRVRRRLREAARCLEAGPGWDIVVSARSGAADANYMRLKEELRALLERAGPLKG